MIDDLVSGGDDEALVVRRIIRASQALQERLTTGWEEEATALAAVIGGTAGADAGDLDPRGGRPHARLDAPHDPPHGADRPC